MASHGDSLSGATLAWQENCFEGNAGLAAFITFLFVLYLGYAFYLWRQAESLYIGEQSKPLLKKSLLNEEDDEKIQSVKPGLREIQDPRLVSLLRVSAYFGMYSSPKSRAPIVCQTTIGLMLVFTPVVKIVYPICSSTYSDIIEQSSVSAIFESTSLMIIPIIFLWYHCFFHWCYHRFLYCRKRDSNKPVAPYFWDNEISREIFCNAEFRLLGREAVLNSSKKWTVLTVWVIYLNVIVVIWSIAYEVNLGANAGLSTWDCMRLFLLSLSTNGLEAVNVNTILILMLHTRMYRKILNVYFRVTKSSLKQRGPISALAIYQSMIDSAFKKLGMLSNVLSLMAIGLQFLLILCVVSAIISPFRQWHNSTFYTFLLGILVTAVWGYFVGHTVTGVFDSFIVPFVQLKQRFGKPGDKKDKFNWCYIEDMLQVAEVCGFDNAQVENIRMACEYWEGNKDKISTRVKNIRRSSAQQNAKGLLQHMKSGSLLNIAKSSTRLSKVMFRNESSESASDRRNSSVASERISAARDTFNAVQFLLDQSLDEPSESVESEVPQKMQDMFTSANATMERFFPKAYRTLLMEVPEELQSLDLDASAELWRSIKANKEFQTQLKLELRSQEALLKRSILSAVVKKIPHSDLLRLIAVPGADQKALLRMLLGTLDEVVPHLQGQMDSLVKTAIARTTSLEKELIEFKTSLTDMNGDISLVLNMKPSEEELITIVVEPN